MLQDMGCGNNVTRVLPPCLLKSGFLDCLFEGKEASDKHPVLKKQPGLSSRAGRQTDLLSAGGLKNVEERASASGGHDGPALIRLSCPVQLGGLELCILKGAVFYSLCRVFTHSPHLKYPFLAWETDFRFPLRNMHTEKRATDKNDKAIFCVFPFSTLLASCVSQIHFQLFLWRKRLTTFSGVLYNYNGLLGPETSLFMNKEW